MPRLVSRPLAACSADAGSGLEILVNVNMLCTDTEIFLLFNRGQCTVRMRMTSARYGVCLSSPCLVTRTGNLLCKKVMTTLQASFLSFFTLKRDLCYC